MTKSGEDVDGSLQHGGLFVFVDGSGRAGRLRLIFRSQEEVCGSLRAATTSPQALFDAFKYH